MSSLRLLLVLLAGLVASPVGATAQPAPAWATNPEPIGSIVSANEDGRSVRTGDTVVVAGRASVTSGVLYRGFLSVWIEDASGGVLLYRRGKPPRHVVEGDSVVAIGVVVPYLGTTELEVLDYVVVPAPRRPPAARPVAPTIEALRARNGRLGTLEGRVVGWGSDVGGMYAVLRTRDRGPNVAMFIATATIAEIELAQYGQGDRLRVTGIVVPYTPTDAKPDAPRAHYRVVLRSAADVELIGASYVLRKSLAIAMPSALLLALAAVLVLRAEVRRKTRKLQESEQRFRSLYEYSPDAIAEYDLSGRLRAGNAALAASVDVPLDRLIGTPMSRWAPPEMESTLAEHAAAAARGEIRRYEVPLSGQGAPTTVDMTLLPVVVGGEVSGFYAVGKDVSASRGARRELEATARLLSTIVETQQAVASAELDVHAVMARIIEQVPRLTPADTAAVGIIEGDEIVMPSILVAGAPLRLAVAGSLSGEAVRTMRVLRCDDALADPRIDTSAQSALGFRSLISVPLSYGGVAIGVLTVSSRTPHAFGETDERTLRLLAGQLAAALSHAREFEAKQELVAERTAALEALQSSEERFRSIIEQSTDLVTIIDEHGVYRWVSPTSERVLGHPAESLIGTNALTLIHPDDVPSALAALHDIAGTSGRSAMIEFRFRHLDGSWHTLEALGRNMIDHPAVRGIVVNSRDITEQRRLEDQLRHAQKMEAVGRLAGGIAHDFNNILTVIRVHSGFLIEAMADRDPRRVDAEEIQRAGDRAATLTKQLLAFSRRQILQTRAIDLNAAIAGIEPMLRRLIGEDIMIVTQLAPEVGQVSADVGQLEQVLMNLAVNARDAMPDGGTLMVHTSEVVVPDLAPPGCALTPGRYAMLAVADTGVGMDKTTLGRVFEPFFTTKEQGKGTGLGLATVYGVVQQSGGAVTAESQPGQGSVFRVYLPCVRGASIVEAPAAPVATPPRGTETILVVEDEDAVRSLARRILGARGYRIIEARNGRDALDRARTAGGEIDLVLTDVVMPEMGGRELAETLTRERPETRVLFMSGYTDDDILRRGLNAPGAAFLHKPFTVHELTDTVRRTLDGGAGTAV